MVRRVASTTSTVLTSAAVGFLLAGVALAGLVPRTALSPSSAADASSDATPPPASTTPITAGFTVWAVDADGTTVRWDPCTPIAVVLDPTGAPPGAEDDLARALTTIRMASGLDITLVGTTDERPSATRAPYQPDRYGDRWAPVLIAWAAPGEAGLPLGTQDRGVAVPVAVRHEGARTFITGQVVLNALRDDLVGGFEDRRDAWGATLIHELGHLVGLGHVDDDREIMATDPGTGEVRLGPGDLAGLAHLGGGGRCRSHPPPRPVASDLPDPDAPSGVRPGR